MSQGVTVSAERNRQQNHSTSQINLISRIYNRVRTHRGRRFSYFKCCRGSIHERFFKCALRERKHTDQNLIMLDGITIYNPSHLGGLFSTFNTDAISDANFRLEGSQPVRGRLGSTLNIVNREGNAERIAGSVTSL